MILVILYRILVKNDLISDIDKSVGDFKIKFGYS